MRLDSVSALRSDREYVKLDFLFFLNYNFCHMHNGSVEKAESSFATVIKFLNTIGLVISFSLKLVYKSIKLKNLTTEQ